jgi:asparagine synthase (glutamine-hydrolysing)
MFGIALWDSRDRTLWLARDRAGIKPLYYVEHAGRLFYGSELKSLLAAGVVEREVDPSALAHYLAFLYTPPDRAIFPGVRKLPPGHLLRWQAGHASVTAFWHPPADEAVAGDEHDAEEQLLAHLRDAVRSHLVSDVPLGAFLSGGIDSSVVVAMMAQVASGPVKTFSIGFADREHDELDKARLVSERYGTDHQELVVEPSSVEILPKLVSHFGEPFADSSALPTYHVSRLAAESVKVALSGDGGDELFIGYTTFQGVELSRALQPVPVLLRRTLARAAGRPPALP